MINHNYPAPVETLNDYLETYRAIAHEVLDESAKPILDWMDETMANRKAD
jgi:hypothetical protein